MANPHKLIAEAHYRIAKAREDLLKPSKESERSRLDEAAELEEQLGADTLARYEATNRGMSSCGFALSALSDIVNQAENVDEELATQARSLTETLDQLKPYFQFSKDSRAKQTLKMFCDTARDITNRISTLAA
ncbi:MAG: hypothetical protein OXU45_05905 [Candidatus Melainabacteria bacterium]|nr:hypothetical protein [Candidatus Melainabacteria bacterium]